MNFALAAFDRLATRFVPRPTGVSPVLPDAPRILISQPGHLGDVVIATALIEPLKALFPGCRIGFLVGSWASRVLERNPAVDHVHVHDQMLLNRARGWRMRLGRHLETRRRSLRDLRAQRYDASIELSFNFPNNIALLHAAGIPTRIGYISGGCGPLLTHPVAWTHRPDWSVMQYHEVLIDRLALGGRHGLGVTRSLLPRTPPSASAVESTLRGSTYTVLHMGSGGPLKEWPGERWRQLVDALLSQGRTLVFTGSGAREAESVRAVIRDSANCIDLCSTLDWEGFVEAIAGAELVIAVDSVAGHVAAAFDVPTVTVGHGMTDASLFKPQSGANIAMRQMVSCLPCYRSRGCTSMDCIRGVAATDVLDAIARRKVIPPI